MLLGVGLGVLVHSQRPDLLPGLVQHFSQLSGQVTSAQTSTRPWRVTAWRDLARVDNQRLVTFDEPSRTVTFNASALQVVDPETGSPIPLPPDLTSKFVYNDRAQQLVPLINQAPDKYAALRLLHYAVTEARRNDPASVPALQRAYNAIARTVPEQLMTEWVKTENQLLLFSEFSEAPAPPGTPPGQP
jgi:hypothetical protein